jgi:nicotinamidase-related amidase
MTFATALLTPADCALVLVDQQVGPAFEVGSIDRQILLDNIVALARSASALGLPIVASGSASIAGGSPLMLAIQADVPGLQFMERRNMNVWEDASVQAAVVAAGRRRLLISGVLSEACVTFCALSALADGYDVLVVADACGGVTSTSHELALRRLEAAGVKLTSGVQVLLELQRDWIGHETHDGARTSVESHRIGYGIGPTYARDMIHPL